ncbi:hypothetical protein K491DRAFT_712052 [Lophiostoma macrostomum CBS 122681]|uniref:Uncharacterized protein n=1 Tax=Lophiostoma macrostomum CBS 122681 TaxID=1314788 RepID=A0A6A6TLC0_9PLEO|nr:hypothetical protein K491DRAFT_712052 [Lophiostoma macrostomum CBS 122681]
MEPSSDYARIINILLLNTLPHEKDDIIRSLVLQVMQGVPPDEDIRLWGFDKLPFPLNAADRQLLKEAWRSFLPVDHPVPSPEKDTSKRRDSHVKSNIEPKSAMWSVKRPASTAFGTNSSRHWEPSAPTPSGTSLPPPRDIPKLSVVTPTRPIQPLPKTTKPSPIASSTPKSPLEDTPQLSPATQYRPIKPREYTSHQSPISSPIWQKPLAYAPKVSPVTPLEPIKPLEEILKPSPTTPFKPIRPREVTPKVSPNAFVEPTEPREHKPDSPPKQPSAKRVRRSKAADTSTAVPASPPKQSSRYPKRLKRGKRTTTLAPLHRPRLVKSVRTYEVMEETQGDAEDSNATLSMEEGQEH